MFGTFLIPLVVGLLPDVNADVYKLKLQELPLNPTLESTYLAAKYGAFNQLAMVDAGHNVPLASSSNFVLLDYKNVQYFTEISIGTPPQTVLILDTAVRCASLSCYEHKKYNSQASSTFKSNGSREVSIPYDLSTLRGVVSNDVFNIGDLRIRGQNFVEVLRDLPLALIFAKFDGVLGLALNDTISVPSPFYNMITEKLITSPVFSFHISPGTSDNYATFGGIDPSAYIGDLSYVPVTRKGRWEVDLMKISFGDDDLDLESGTSATIDTTSLIVMPTNVADFLNAQIGAKRAPTGSFEVPCAKVDSLPEFSFYFGGKAYRLKGTDYILNVQGTCISSFVGLDMIFSGSQWVVGAVFLRKYYTVFDSGRAAIGFAHG
ncbi:hypothetical protein K443DRAFT_135617 [Laccaria amethystina LaAM-08-1]|uniref:Peptidase A1 domain-containing protein n=1 Tax=Laccaria amethystina LaAM-08-1 TaxID=1095629 RepID=A0A0C9WZS0_9AGAR|nr:hypothetical protein K443DRAFT_135617 [Laccaria amethystina LaAM-08-1]